MGCTLGTPTRSRPADVVPDIAGVLGMTVAAVLIVVRLTVVGSEPGPEPAVPVYLPNVERPPATYTTGPDAAGTGKVRYPNGVVVVRPKIQSTPTPEPG